MTKLETPTLQLSNEVETRMQAQLAGNPSALISNLEHRINNNNNPLRPTLILLFGSMFGVERDTLVNLAASIEMLQNATLVHDDLADKAGEQVDKKLPDSLFMTSATILAGDLAFAAAARLATAAQSTAVMKIYSQTLQFMVSGEITHLFQNGSGFDREIYYRRIHAKTASLFELACQAAAILGATKDEMGSTARQFGYEIGMAYQIVEDTLHFTSDPATHGKPTDNNLGQGIATLPMIYYFEAYPHDPDIRSIINRNGHGPEAIERVITAIRESDAIEQAINEAKTFVQRGLEISGKFPNTPERAELELLATQIIPSEN